jgi:single-stranded DNA-specific DHH superfamily exonuclease
MGKILNIIFSLIGALLLFLAGWFAHAWKNRGNIAKEVKKTIVDLNEERKKAEKAIRDSYEEKLKQKEEIIQRLYKIIERLIGLFEPLQKDNVFGANRVMNNITKNKKRLDKIADKSLIDKRL